MTIAIVTDDQLSFCPSQYEYSFAGTRNVFEFNTYKVIAQSEKELEQSSNPFAVAILTVLLAVKQKKQDDNILLGLKTALVKQLLSRRFETGTIRSLFNFINRYVRFASPETNIIFEKEIESLTGKHSTMGIEEVIVEMARQEGKKEGKLEGSSFFVENLLRSTDFNVEKIASLAGVAVSFVEMVKKQSGL